MSDLLALLDWRILATIAAAAGVYFLFMREAPKQASKASTGPVFSQAEAEKEKAKTMKEYTMEEVAKHKTLADGVWLVVNAKVYDVTKFAPEHPGQLEAILKVAGTDCTKGFFGDQHPDTVREMINRYQIGTVKK